MPVATTTLLAAGLMAGTLGNAYKDSRKSASAVLPPIKPVAPPVYLKPDIARAVSLQRSQNTGVNGRAGTIKTGPNGLPPAVKPKTLIGE